MKVEKYQSQSSFIDKQYNDIIKYDKTELNTLENKKYNYDFKINSDIKYYNDDYSDGYSSKIDSRGKYSRWFNSRTSTPEPPLTWEDVEGQQGNRLLGGKDDTPPQPTPQFFKPKEGERIKVTTTFGKSGPIHKIPWGTHTTTSEDYEEDRKNL